MKFFNVLILKNYFLIAFIILNCKTNSTSLKSKFTSVLNSIQSLNDTNTISSNNLINKVIKGIILLIKIILEIKNDNMKVPNYAIPETSRQDKGKRIY